MKATLTVQMDNAAFEEAPELELIRILEDLIKKIESRGLYGPINAIDFNGNKVGQLRIERDWQ